MSHFFFEYTALVFQELTLYLPPPHGELKYDDNIKSRTGKCTLLKKKERREKVDTVKYKSRGMLTKRFPAIADRAVRGKVERKGELGQGGIQRSRENMQDYSRKNQEILGIEKSGGKAL